MQSHPKIHPQKVLNGEIHNWYRITLGFSDQLVSGLLDKFEVESGQWVLDPFCGSGTTLVECKKRGVNSIGIDANPSSFFASKVKVNWGLNISKILQFAMQIEGEYKKEIKNSSSYKADPTFTYLSESGMLERGWISPKPLKKSIVLKRAISTINLPLKYRELYFLALVDEVVTDASNIKFGPQPYCSDPKDDVDVLGGFLKRINNMANDLKKIKPISNSVTKVLLGDARECDRVVLHPRLFTSVICSPPYPGEHDYTRHSRLELAFLEDVTDKGSLRLIKRRMIRSNTKGIYKEDNDFEYVVNNESLEPIIRKINKRAKDKSHGFARLYSTVVQEYFGGMKKHLINLKKLLKPGAQCAYVVGDQSSYLQVHIPTAKILGEIADELGYQVVEISPWRTTWATRTSKKLNENILIFKKR